MRNVQQMQINAVNVKQDLIQKELHVNYAIQFIQNVPHVQQQLRHVLPVPQDIMYPEEVVLNVQIR